MFFIRLVVGVIPVESDRRGGWFIPSGGRCCEQVTINVSHDMDFRSVAATRTHQGNPLVAVFTLFQ